MIEMLWSTLLALLFFGLFLLMERLTAWIGKG